MSQDNYRMRAVITSILMMVALVPASRVAFGETALSVEGLRCEYLSNPLGIDVEKPRRSWTLAPRTARPPAECLPGAGGRDPGDPPAKQGGPVGFRQDSLGSDCVRGLCRGAAGLGNSGVVESPRLGSRGPRHAMERPGPLVNGGAPRLGLIRPVDRPGVSRGCQRRHSPAIPLAAQDLHAG